MLINDGDYETIKVYVCICIKIKGIKVYKISRYLR